jgi:hypothetical protein
MPHLNPWDSLQRNAEQSQLPCQGSQHITPQSLVIVGFAHIFCDISFSKEGIIKEVIIGD